MKEIILPADMYNIIAYHLGVNDTNEYFECNIMNPKGSLKFIKGEMKEEKKMTREEAVNILNKKVFFENSKASVRWINAFEALGLIKFEEEKIIPVDELNAVKFLRKIGYTVTRNV